ncbi:MAG: acetyl/propionyl/methylcrotonyl-CoA carboxylase subunit alpha [Methylocella sp.]
MFKKILIANRGEIACRVIKTARRMGISTVAVYSDADRDALHVQLADEALAIGPSPAAQSYLDIEKIVAASKASGAQAVHPGYGFLSERAAFAQALLDQGIVFIGPNPKAIEAMGDKIASKIFAKAANISIIPGFIGAIEEAADAAKIAEGIGYPVMIKASAGGGGKGMRIAYAAEDLAEGFLRAKSEAKSSFGDDRVFIEKFIDDPRHIEIQVLGDKHGALIHLGERECSIQRRNQKVIEEAPSPLLDEALRGAMGEQAVALARAVNYDSAGTVEFIVDQNKNFYFLEMNTRLQVEHPVTELVTGVDIVEQMIRVAAGEPLTIKQSDIHMRGWAIESRIYAEDPQRNFLPSTGRLRTYRPPTERRRDGVTLRIDAGVGEGGEISIHYDPMIAKLATHAGDRGGAIEAQAQALDQFAIDGIRHNIPFLAAVMGHPRWRAGRLSTGFIAQEFPAGFAPLSPSNEMAHRLATVAASVDHAMNERKRLISGQMHTSRPVSFERDRSVLLGGARYDVRLDDGDAGLLVRFEASGQAHLCSSNWGAGQPVWTGAIDGEPISIQLRPILNGFALMHRGIAVEAYVYTRREAELAALMPEKALANGSKALLCPMPGVVKAIHVAAGQDVKAGQALCMLEAMKMENVLHAEHDVTIRKICAKVGDSLAVETVIMEFV